MAIQTETYEVNGRELIKHYSDLGMMIERDGIQYPEAVDLIDSGRTYTETDIPIDDGNEEATIEDYIEEIERMGVDLSEEESIES